MARTESKNSMWTGPMRVTTAMSGRRMSRSGAISPGWLMPASITPKAQSRPSPATLSGRPISLLKLPDVRAVRPRVPSRSATSSFVSVLPTLPVTPTRRAGSCRR